MVTILNIPYFEYIGTAGVVIILAFVLWFFLKNSDSSRLGMENREISRDKRILDLDVEARNEEKKERKDAERLRELFENLNKRAIEMRLHGEDDEKARYVMSTLKSIIDEKIDLKDEVAEFQILARTILLYIHSLGDVTSLDRLLDYYRQNIAAMLKRLGVDLKTEWGAIEARKRLEMEAIKSANQEEGNMAA